MDRGAPSANTPEPRPVSRGRRVAFVAPFTEVDPPSKVPASQASGPLYVCRLNKLYKADCGSIRKCSHFRTGLIAQPSLRSNVKNASLPIFPLGAEANCN